MVVLGRAGEPGRPELWLSTLLNLYSLLLENTAPSTSYPGFLIPSHFRPNPSCTLSTLPVSIVSGFAFVLTSCSPPVSSLCCPAPVSLAFSSPSSLPQTNK